MLWGAKDRFLGREMALPSLDRCGRGELHFFEQATHWVLHEEPKAVSARLIEFFRR